MNPFTIYTPLERTIVLDEYSLIHEQQQAAEQQQATENHQAAPSSTRAATEQQQATAEQQLAPTEIGMIDLWYRKNIVLISLIQWFIIAIMIVQIIKLKR